MTAPETGTGPPAKVAEGTGDEDESALVPQTTPRVPAWAETLTRLLDDALRIPGTKIGVGLDALLGFLLPGAGDALTGLGSLSLLWLALRSGVPTVVLGRMVINIALDAGLGVVPFLGDIFDLAFRANRKNLELLKAYQADPNKRAGALDYALVFGGLLLVVLSILIPVLVTLTLVNVIASVLGR